MATSQLTALRLLRPSLSHRLLRVGVVLVAFYLTIALLAPVFQAWGWLQSPTELLSNVPLQPPSAVHWFGTNLRGYDVFSRTIFGSQAALQVVLLGTTISLVVGVPLGMISGYLGGRVDKVLLFLMDTIYTLPGLLLSKIGRAHV